MDGLKKALREAKSITYPQDGASRGYIDKMFERLGIATEVKPKIILAQGSGPATQSVADGKAGFVITLFSEILPIKGVDILGALPGEFQSDIKFSRRNQHSGFRQAGSQSRDRVCDRIEGHARAEGEGH